MKLTQLQIKHLAISTLEHYAKLAYEREYRAFRMFIGQKVFSVNGGILKKFEHPKATEFEGDGRRLFNKVPYWVTRTYWIDDSHGNVWLKVKISVHGGKYEDKTYFCQYEERAILLGENKEGLFHLADWQDFPPVPSIEELTAAAEHIKSLERQYEQAIANIDSRFYAALNIKRLTHS